MNTGEFWPTLPLDEWKELMYDDVRNSESPRQALLDFAQSTYDAGAHLANWNRAELESTAD